MTLLADRLVDNLTKNKAPKKTLNQLFDETTAQLREELTHHDVLHIIKKGDSFAPALCGAKPLDKGGWYSKEAQEQAAYLSIVKAPVCQGCTRTYMKLTRR